MFDKMTTIAIYLLDKHLVLASLVIGILSLYLLGFNADNLVQTPYILLAGLLADMFVRIACYIHILFKLEDTKNNTENTREMLTQIKHILEISESLADVHVSIVDNINLLNTSIVKLCNITQNIPNKFQLRVFTNMRTKLFIMEILEQCVSAVYTTSLSNTFQSMTSMNRKKMALDFHKRLEFYYKEIAVYFHQSFVNEVKNEITPIIDIYLDDIVDLMDSNILPVEKLYNMIIMNTSIEEQLIDVWDKNIRSLPDNMNIKTELEVM